MKLINIPPTYIAFSIILIFICFILLPEYNFIILPYNLTGLLIIYFGIVIMGKSRELFQKNNTTLDIKSSRYLIQEGIFSKTRNPMYLGMFLLLLGLAVCFMNIFSIIVPFLFIIAMNYIFVKKEEKLLFEAFGLIYIDYQKKVRKWI